MFHFVVNSTNANAATYLALDGAPNSSTTEADVQLSMDFPLLIRRFRVRVMGNNSGKDATTTIALRNNGATITSVSVTAAATGEFNTGTLSIPIVVGDLVNGLMDTSASSAGTIGFVAYIYCQRVVE